VALHLLDSDAESDEGLAGRLADPVVAREVAAVVEGDGSGELHLPGPQPPLRDELGDDLAVVEHLEVPAELRVLVGEGVEAVRALRDDLLEAVAPERLHVLLRERLEQVLVAEPARRVAVAGLLLAQDAEGDPRLLEDLHDRARDLLLPLVEAPGATD